MQNVYIGVKNKGNAKQKRKDPHFVHVQWNVHSRTTEGLPRTSNNVEGWHLAFSHIVSHHPHLLKLIDVIKL